MGKQILKKLANILSLVIFYLVVLFFIISFNFQDNMMNGWYPQYLTSLPGVSQLVFLDSLTGYYLGGSQYLVKTTNGGDNWFIFKNFGDSLIFNNIQFLNSDSMILCTAKALFKSTDGGNNWLYFPFPTYSEITAYAMHSFSMDSIWIAGYHGIPASVLLTTNGGLNWIDKFQNSRDHFDKIYFFNRNIGYTCWSSSYDIFKTTNGGDNWFVIPEQFRYINFIDSLTGWKSYGTMKKTTNGGINWINQVLPSGGIISLSSMIQFSNINLDTIWGCGGHAYYNWKGIIYLTTNSGNNWGYQIPDTNTIKFPKYHHSEFVNKNNGWEYLNTTHGGVHTTTGGSDTTIYMAIRKISGTIPDAFILKQNYPNPFNGSTIIEYSIKQQGWVKLKIFDISGREIATFVNEVQATGTYGVPVSVELSSGVYFYKLFFTNKEGEMQMETKKMISIK